MINITDINPAEIMIGAIVGQIVNVLWNFTERKLSEIRPIKELKNIKTVKVLEFSLAYILPLGTIVFLIVENNAEPTFKNIALFIIICITLVYNILMNSISSIYKMMQEILEINSKKFSEIDSYAERINSVLNNLKEK
jgi:hypothetical protein